MLAADSVFAVTAFSDNYIWVIRNDKNAVAVDPGDAAPLLGALRDRGLRLCAVLITHHHEDHQGGVPEVLRQYPELSIFGPASENIYGRTVPLSGGERLTLPGIDQEFQVLDVSGHTRGHLAYFTKHALFCGDALFSAGCGRVFEGTPQHMYTSLAKIAELPDDTRIYCAHEYTAKNLDFARHIEADNAALDERLTQTKAALAAGQPSVPSTLAQEKLYNPFLRCHTEAMISAARCRDPDVDGTDPVAVFAVLRSWRNTW